MQVKVQVIHNFRTARTALSPTITAKNIWGVADWTLPSEVMSWNPQCPKCWHLRTTICILCFQLGDNFVADWFWLQPEGPLVSCDSYIYCTRVNASHIILQAKLDKHDRKRDSFWQCFLSFDDVCTACIADYSSF